MASKTSGMNFEMVFRDTRDKYSSERYESPVDKYRKVIANFVRAGIASRVTFCFVILASIYDKYEN